MVSQRDFVFTDASDYDDEYFEDWRQEGLGVYDEKSDEPVEPDYWPDEMHHDEDDWSGWDMEDPNPMTEDMIQSIRAQFMILVTNDIHMLTINGQKRDIRVVYQGVACEKPDEQNLRNGKAWLDDHWDEFPEDQQNMILTAAMYYPRDWPMF